MGVWFVGHTCMCTHTHTAANFVKPACGHIGSPSILPADHYGTCRDGHVIVMVGVVSWITDRVCLWVTDHVQVERSQVKLSWRCGRASIEAVAVGQLNGLRMPPGY